MIRLLVILAILGLPSTSLARILSFDIEPKQILRFTSHNDGSSITVSASVADEFLKLTQNHVGQTVAVTIDGHPYAVFTIQTTYRAESFRGNQLPERIAEYIHYYQWFAYPIHSSKVIHHSN